MIEEASAVKMKKKQKNKIYSFYLPLILLAIGAAARLIYLGTVPGGLHNDESYAAWNAYSLCAGGVDSAGYAYPVYFDAWGHGQSALYTYLLLPLLYWPKAQITPFLIRLPQAVVAILSLWVFYLLLKRMFSQKNGTVGAFDTGDLSMAYYDVSLGPGY